MILSTDLAKALGVDHRAVAKIVVRHGLKMPRTRVAGKSVTGGRPEEPYEMDPASAVYVIASLTSQGQKRKQVIAKAVSAMTDFQSLLDAVAAIDLAECPGKKIYFAVEEETGRVKIGISCNPERRVKELSVGNPNTLRIVMSYDAEDGFREERRLHDLFSANRIRGEWFDRGVPLLTK
jgi:hypothetical protein